MVKDNKSKGKENAAELSSILFGQLDLLTNEDDMVDNYERRIETAKQVGNIASKIIANNNFVLKAEQFKDYNGLENKDLPEILRNE